MRRNPHLTSIFFPTSRYLICSPVWPSPPVPQINMLVIELKSEALKDRHWKQLMKRLHVNWVLSELTLGQVWDIDLQKNEMVVKDVLLVAQGEMALEEFLKQVNVHNTLHPHL